MDKKEARRRGYGPPQDIIFTDDESDQSFEKVPEIPEGLLEKTLNKLQRASKFEIDRNADPRRIDFICTMERLTGKPYDKTPTLLEKALVKVLNAFGYYGKYGK